MTSETTWPDCIGENASSLARPVNWAAACARTQMRNGADIGSAGRAILDAKAARIDQEGHCGLSCGDCARKGSCASVTASGGLNVNGDLGEAL